jgi:hypothetical protein
MERGAGHHGDPEVRRLGPRPAPRSERSAATASVVDEVERRQLLRGRLGDDEVCSLERARRKIVRGWPCEVVAAPLGAETARRV